MTGPAIEVWGSEAGTIREDLKILREKFRDILSAIEAAERGEGVIRLNNTGVVIAGVAGPAREGRRLTQEIINLIGGVD